MLTSSSFEDTIPERATVLAKQKIPIRLIQNEKWLLMTTLPVLLCGRRSANRGGLPLLSVQKKVSPQSLAKRSISTKLSITTSILDRAARVPRSVHVVVALDPAWNARQEEMVGLSTRPAY